jgi:hypothetical protein
MSDGASYDKAFTRARLQAADELRRNGNLSAAARLVGWEILSCVNRVSGCAYPSEETIADRLGITGRTVRTAIKQLRTARCIQVTRLGRRNVYFPTFVDGIEENISPIETAVTPEKFDRNTGKKRHRIPEKNNPLTLLSNPVRTLSTEVAAEEKRKKRKARQKTECEIAEVIGWECVTEIPQEEFEDLCRRWPDVDAAELFEVKEKYEPPAAVEGRRARAAGGA